MCDHFAVIDLETTGLDPCRDRVVELACVLVDGGAVGATWQTLVDPKTPIPALATSVHGIGDQDVAGAPELPAALRMLQPMLRERTIAAHNARFDVAFLRPAIALPAVCTMRLARLLVPYAPNFKNQTLRKYLRLDRYLNGTSAHRALGDALVTAYLLVELRQRARDVRTWRAALRRAEIA